MQVAILSARTGWHTDELCRALTARGHIGRVLPYEALTASIAATAQVNAAGVPLLDCDAVLARIIPNGSLEQIIYRVDSLHVLEQHGVPVLNSPRAIERCVDKFYTTALLQRAGLPVPETVVCERLEDALTAVRILGDVIVKPLFGSMGHGLVRLSDPDTAFRVLRAFEQVRGVFYIQRVVPNPGRDLRIFVVGGRVLAAIERQARDDDWRANVTRGATAVPCTVPTGWADLAVRAAAAVGADYAGVDLLPSDAGKPYVIEVNGIPGWQGLQQATGCDVAGAIVDHLLDRIEHGPSGARTAGALHA